jgi:hypothetical protein
MKEGKSFLQGSADENPRDAEAQESRGTTWWVTTNREQDAQLISEAQPTGAPAESPRVFRKSAGVE